jgi:acyl-CoA synthetase (AMP-forming)/AMP-acid ligase II
LPKEGVGVDFIEAEADEFRAFLKDHLTPYKIPRHFVIVEGDFPRTPYGKVIKGELLRGFPGTDQGEGTS